MDLQNKEIHMVGIGGIGMSGISFILNEMGCKVTGSDVDENNIVKKLREKGIRVDLGHKRINVGKSDIVVYSSSIRDNNPELIAARRKNIPALPRIHILKMLMDRYKRSIAISGTHGKTTTTAMASLVLEEAGFDPTVILGGESPHFNGNARMGKGDTVVAEADESDGRFVILRPTHFLMTNLEREHTEHYRSESHLVSVFEKFMKIQSPQSIFFYRFEDDNLRKLARIAGGRTISFGFSKKADIYASNIKIVSGKTEYDCFNKGKIIGRFSLNIPGRHNITNSLAAIALGTNLKIDRTKIRKTLLRYKSVRRRFELIGNLKGAKIIEDYAHHPTEIRATISAANSMKPKRIITVFQPHRYTRTKSFYKEFSNSFSGSDEVILTDVYSASENKIKGAGIESIYDIMVKENSVPVRLLKKDKIPSYVSGKIRKGDMVLVLGAGDIGKTAREMLECGK